MLRTLMRSFNKEGNLANLEDLRNQLTERLALLLTTSSGLAAWLLLLPEPFPLILAGLLVGLLGLGIAVQRLMEIQPVLARHLLIWGITCALLAAMYLYPDSWLPFLGLLPIFVSAMLAPGSEIVTGGILVLLAAWLVQGGFRVYPLTSLSVALTLDVALAWLTMRTLYTALQWVWTMQQRANSLLEEVRAHRGQLSQTLKSVELANQRLQRTERELIVARRQAEEARRLKEQFAANISHELRTPLNLILGFSEVMHLSPEVYGESNWSLALRRDVYQIYRSAQHLLEMIDDVLDLSRFEMVGFTLDKEPTSLELLLQDTVEIAQSLCQGRPVHLVVEHAADLPNLALDRTRIRQVLLNLLNNAVRFTEAGTVRVEAKRANSEVMISVHDTGPGIPLDELPYLFDEFYQVDRSLHRKHGGAGLGLAISKHFVEAHDGRIWVESQQGVGSTFTFTLPVPEQHVPLSRLHVSRPLEWLPDGVHPTLLVVDPDPAVATLIDRHVEGYDVLPVEDVGGVAEMVRRHRPRAVIWNVPPGEPDSVPQSPAIPVPVIQCSLPSQTWVARDLRVTDCLNKPITAQRLLQAIERQDNIHRVLVVDDDRNFCQLVERMLEASGRIFHMRSAYSGEDGLHVLRTWKPDLMLLDLIMPNMNGLQVLEEVRREAAPEGLPEVPIVLLTATSLAEDALAQRSGQIVIRYPSAPRPVEILRCLNAVIGELPPRAPA